MNFTLLGIKFNVSVIFAASLSLFLAFDSSKIFLPLLLSVIIHEGSHILFLCFFNAKPKEISLDIGTISIKNTVVLSNDEELLVLLAGPLSNLIIFLLTSVFEIYTNFKNINLFLFLINMLFIDGLDGGEIINILLCKFFSKKITTKILKILKIFNISILILLFVVGLYHNIVNYSLLLFAIYLVINKKSYIK